MVYVVDWMVLQDGVGCGFVGDDFVGYVVVFSVCGVDVINFFCVGEDQVSVLFIVWIVVIFCFKSDQLFWLVMVDQIVLILLISMLQGLFC